MEASTEKTEDKPSEMIERPTGLTAKQMAEQEELNAARMQKMIAAQQDSPASEPVKIAEVASRGYDALHEQFRRHNEMSKPKPYVPPPRTQRQMDALREEMEAGAKTSARAAEQLAAAKPVKPDGNKEGFTTPVYRPNNVVPDPIRGGMKEFGTDA
jgi:histidinol dehydrogenase